MPLVSFPLEIIECESSDHTRKIRPREKVEQLGSLQGGSCRFGKKLSPPPRPATFDGGPQNPLTAYQFRIGTLSHYWPPPRPKNRSCVSTNRRRRSGIFRGCGYGAPCPNIRFSCYKEVDCCPSSISRRPAPETNDNRTMWLII